MGARRLIVLLSLLMLVLSSCEVYTPLNVQERDNGYVPSPVTLSFMFFGDKPTDMDKVLQEFEKRTKQTLNVKIDMKWDAPEEFKQKVKLKLAAGEQIDAVFDASWMNLEQNVAQGYYRNLDKYFNNEQYPGLLKAFSPEFLEANKIDGHLYTVPFVQFFHDIEIVYIRKDLREKLGMAPIQSYDDLEHYFQNVQRLQPDLIPFALKGDRGFFRLFANEDKQITTRMDPYYIVGSGVSFQVVLSEDGKRILGATTYGDPVSAYENLPAPYNDPDYMYRSLDRFVAWNPYVQKDVLNERNPTLLFESGKSAAFEGTLTFWADIKRKLQTAVPGADLEGFVYSTCMRNQEAGCIGTDYRAWNNLAIPVTSKHVDETMRFLDWVYQSQENHDLFELGIEGEHWTEAGGQMFKATSKSSNYLFNAFELTWNPLMSRINMDTDPEALKLLRYSADPQTYYQLPLAGFTFNPASVRTEIAKLQPLFQQMLQVFNVGLDPNWRVTAAKTNEKLRGLGLEAIREELIKQVQAYLDKGGI